MLRGIRGATTVTADRPEAIRAAAAELLREIVSRNRLDPDQIAACLFSQTSDLVTAFAATAARPDLGWDRVPLYSSTEPAVAGSLPRCIRVLVLANVPPETGPEAPRHVYLREAAALRPDLLEETDA